MSINPESDPDLHTFLAHMVGFDSVDDESKPEPVPHGPDCPLPENWNKPENPSYSYYLYYMYANLTVLNQLRRAKGLSTFYFHPHAGEAGSSENLVAAYLTSEKISHGIRLRKAPALQYLYYLTQVGICLSPLSNNSLFLNYDRSPFPDFFAIGMNVSLSTGVLVVLRRRLLIVMRCR